MTIAVVAAAILASTLGAACGTSAYDEARDDWTRTEEAFDEFEARAFIDATLKVEPFRRAYVREYARLYALTPAQEADLLAAELADDRDNLVLIVSFYTPERRWNDLNPARGFWEVRLENGRGDTLPPYSVTRLDARNPLWRTLFPTFGAHDMLYEVRFERALPEGRPLAARGDTLTLVVAGAPVRVRLSWSMP
ncbi:MAG: hypothetical protein IT385_07250 [Deltaproteobacteria bacterium]|nr:hypothetical protein [Deltaproteobacteria bacterium]